MEADVKANKSKSLKVRVLSDRRLSSGKFLKHSRTISTSQIKVYFGCRGTVIELSRHKITDSLSLSLSLGCSPIFITCIGPLKADNAAMCDPFVFIGNLHQENPANKSRT